VWSRHALVYSVYYYHLAKREVDSLSIIDAHDSINILAAGRRRTNFEPMAEHNEFASSVQLPSGLRLQTSMIAPSGGVSDSKKLAVLSHPWSRLGGSMHDP